MQNIKADLGEGWERENQKEIACVVQTDVVLKLFTTTLLGHQSVQAQVLFAQRVTLLSASGLRPSTSNYFMI